MVKKKVSDHVAEDEGDHVAEDSGGQMFNQSVSNESAGETLSFVSVGSMKDSRSKL